MCTGVLPDVCSIQNMLTWTISSKKEIDGAHEMVHVRIFWIEATCGRSDYDKNYAFACSRFYNFVKQKVPVQEYMFLLFPSASRVYKTIIPALGPTV